MKSTIKNIVSEGYGRSRRGGAPVPERYVWTGKVALVPYHYLITTLSR